MSLSSELHTSADIIIGKILLELSLTTPGSEEGLIPVYSLLGDLESTLHQEPLWTKPVHDLLTRLGCLLDQAAGFTPAILADLHRFLEWAQESLAASRRQETPVPAPDFSPSEGGSPTPPPAPGPQHGADLDDDLSPSDDLMIVPLGDDNELLQEFYGEAVDHLEVIEAAVLVLEDRPDDPETLNNVFRAFHSLKGVSGFLHLSPIQKLSHQVEHLLDLARGRKLLLNSAHITLILQSKDRIQILVEQVGKALQAGELPTAIVPIHNLIGRLEQAALTPASSLPDAPVGPVSPPPAAASPPPEPSRDSGQGFFPAPGFSSPEPASPSTHERFSSPISPGAPAPANAPGAVAAAASKGQANGDFSTIRVNTLKLDNLMDMVGELVIVESQLMESARLHAASRDGGLQENSPLQRNLSQLKRITKELQHTSMALRMVPVKPTFQKMGRIVRDIARAMGKEVNFLTQGEDTELDRNVIEQIGDPLMHMVRNAIDHGLELPEIRRQRGKVPQGSIQLSAYHSGGNIVLELRDDGGGIPTRKVLQKAREKGLVDPSAEPSQREIINLIFHPGFSTAEKVTEVSGRGVGMDVVRRNVENLRGSVEVDSIEGRGSTFKIKLPLTMAIIDGLIVRVGSDRFILPTTSVRVALKLKSGEVGRIQGRQEVVDFRGRCVPILKLAEIFNLSSGVRETTEGITVILESFGKPFGLLVDEMIGKQEVVIKNLGSIMGKIQGVAGGAILGDGNIALILDPPALARAG